jgi:hypothetical protein
LVTILRLEVLLLVGARIPVLQVSSARPQAWTLQFEAPRVSLACLKWQASEIVIAGAVTRPHIKRIMSP